MARRGTKADNVGKAKRSNTTAAARRGYGRGKKAGDKAAARSDAGEGVVAAAPAAPATGKAAKAAARAGKPDFPPPAGIDHSAQATDTPPPQLDTKINKDGSRSEK
jgi:hypothetical protein